MKERFEKFSKYMNEHEGLRDALGYGIGAACAFGAYAIMAHSFEVTGAEQFVFDDGHEILVIKQRNGKIKTLKKGKSREIESN